jgi:hypothetical protein
VGNDSRLSDARTPTAHTQAWSTITSTPTTRSGYGITDAAASTHSHPESEVTNLVTDLGNKQATLVSGTNIKTVNGNTLLGSGDVAISGSAAWGSITGTLSNQTDVYNSLNSKEPSLGIPASDGYVLSSTIGGTRSWIAPGGGGGVDMATIVDLIRVKPFLYTDFLGVAGATTVEAAYPFDYAVISSGTQAKIAGEQNHPGILRTSSSTTTNSGGYCIIEGTAFRLTGGEVFELTFQHRVASGTATTLRFGFLDNTTSSDAVDGCYFECPAASLALVGKTSSNSTRSTTATIYTLTVNTWYRAKVVVNSNATSVTFYLYNDAGSLLGSQSLTTNIPTASGRETGAGFVATNSGTTATLLAYWDWMALWFNDRALVR